MEDFSILIISVGLLFTIGFLCLIVKRDAIRLLMGIEIMFNAANLAFITFSTQKSGFIDPYSQSVVMITMVLDGAVIAVGLAIVMNVYRHYKTLDVRKLRRLKW
jgi:NADH:ubiquinone oxidoreductase subunit K